MRRVKFDNWEKVGENEKGAPINELIEREGLFVQWGAEQDGDSLQCYTVAIVEMSDGTVATPLPTRVRFIDPPEEDQAFQLVKEVQAIAKSVNKLTALNEVVMRNDSLIVTPDVT